jgi:hypothetical protein
MSRMAQWIISGTLATLVAAPCALALQAPPAAKPRDGVLSGVVTNSIGVPIGKVEVAILNTDLRVITSDSGEYHFPAAPTGKVRVVARRIGFEPDERSVTLVSSTAKQLDFELKGIPELLDSVMVREAGGRGRLSDFWARRMVGNGAFITRDEIDRRRPHHSSDLLRTVTGVKVTMGESGFDRVLITMGRNPQLSAARGTTSLASACRVSYYVDGSPAPGGTFHMDDISPLAVEAVEIYRGPAETPVRFRQRDSACGVIVIWTRDPSRRDPGQRE